MGQLKRFNVNEAVPIRNVTLHLAPLPNAERPAQLSERNLLRSPGVRCKNSRVLGNDDFLVPELKMLTFMPSLESSIIPTSIPIEGDPIERTIPATSWPKLTAVCSEG